MTYPDTPGFVKGSETSEEAANKVKDTAPSMRKTVEQFLLTCGEKGAIQQEVGDYLLERGLTKTPANCVSSRLRECELGGTAMRAYDDKNKPVTRVSSLSGMRQQVWVATGRDYTPPVKSTEDYVLNANARNALLSLDKWILTHNDKQGGWWMREDGWLIRRKIAEMIGGTVKGKKSEIAVKANG